MKGNDERRGRAESSKSIQKKLLSELFGDTLIDVGFSPDFTPNRFKQ